MKLTVFVVFLENVILITVVNYYNMKTQTEFDDVIVAL